jgi:hypothetical protein
MMPRKQISLDFYEAKLKVPKTRRQRLHNVQVLREAIWGALAGEIDKSEITSLLGRVYDLDGQAVKRGVPHPFQFLIASIVRTASNPQWVAGFFLRNATAMI